MVTLLSVAPSFNFHNKPTTQHKTKIPSVGGAITCLLAELFQSKKKFLNLFLLPVKHFVKLQMKMVTVSERYELGGETDRNYCFKHRLYENIAAIKLR